MEFKLIVKKLNQTLNQEERQIFESWYNESEDHRIYFKKVKDNYYKEISSANVEKGWERVSSKINKNTNRNSKYKYAAVIAALFMLGYLWYFNSNISLPKNMPNPSIAKDEIVVIGTDKATLTLEDGSKIVLDKDGHYETENVTSNGKELVYKKGDIRTNKIPKENILTIPRAGQFFVILEDGTKVWMNSDTRIRYPDYFLENKTREVELVYGEAYFEVSPSSKHNGARFIVHSDGQQVEVLGTEFNIKSYKEDSIIATTLVEGKVFVSTESTSENLTPGHQSILNRGTSKLIKSKANMYDAISWKSGLFSFKNQSLADIMKVLSRWYDVQVVFHNENTKSLTFNGVFRKSQPLDEILDIIKNTNEVNYTINGKTVTME